MIEGEEFSEDVFDAFVRKGDAVGYIVLLNIF